MGDVTVERALPEVAAMAALDAALRDALGNKFTGCSASRGRIIVHLTGEATAQDENAAVTLVTNHDMEARTAEQLAEINAATKVAGAVTAAGNIPGWATWDEATALAWIDGNVNSLADARTALKAMARMVIALRDATWPNLS